MIRTRRRRNILGQNPVNRSFICIVIVLLVSPSFAAGPILSGNDQPVSWGNDLVRYAFDPGPLGNLTSFEATQLVNQAFAVWESVDTATVRFLSQGKYTVDINADNYLDFVAYAKQEGHNAVIFDDDGSILDLILGEDSAKSILGLTHVDSSPAGRIEHARTTFNGAFLGQDGYTAEEFFSTVLHETGHFIGLDHSQLFLHLATNSYGPDDRYIPVLFPTATDDEAERPLLSLDDRSSVSMSYPAYSFQKEYGEIHGQVFGEGGRYFPGVNVLARKVDEPYTVATTCVSDYRRRGTGEYRLAGLPPGDYLIWVEPIQPNFYGSSQVGPYSESSSSLSFVRVPRAEFYNGENETYDEELDYRSEATPVTVKAGQTVEGIDLYVNRNPDPDGEYDAVLLSNNQTEISAVEGRSGYRVMDSYQFLYFVSDKDDRLDIEVETEQMARIQLHIRHEARVEFDEYDARREGLGDVKLTRSRDGPNPLKTGRYFISVANQAGRTLSYTLTVRAIHYPEGDLDRDGVANVRDLYRFSNRWRQPAGDSNARENLVPDEKKEIDSSDLRRLIDILRPR